MHFIVRENLTPFIAITNLFEILKLQFLKKVQKSIFKVYINQQMSRKRKKNNVVRFYLYIL